jgi:hypothetical protein
MDGQTISTNSGSIGVYNNPYYPTDLMLVYANISGSFGGLTLAPQNGLIVALQDVTGTIFNDVSLPGPELQTNYFTSGNASFLQLMSTDSYRYDNKQAIVSRGELAGLPITPSNIVSQQYIGAVPEADTSAMLLMGAGVMGFMARRRKQAAA